MTSCTSSSRSICAAELIAVAGAARDRPRVRRDRRATRRVGARPAMRPHAVLDHVARQEVPLHERAERAADAILLRRHDRRVRNRNAERMAEERRDREPVGEPADHRRFHRRAHDAEPRLARLERARDDEQHRGARRAAASRGASSSRAAPGASPRRARICIARGPRGAGGGASRCRRRRRSRRQRHRGVTLTLREVDEVRARARRHVDVEHDGASADLAHVDLDRALRRLEVAALAGDSRLAR